MEADRLRSTIQEAFSNVSVPAGRIVSCPCPECEQLQVTFGGRQWASLSTHEVFIEAMSLSLLTLEAFHYYLPAYLCVSLQNDDESWDVRFQTTVFLGELLSKHPGEWADERQLVLSPNQVSAVVAYCEFIALTDEELIEEATKAHDQWVSLLDHEQ